MIENTEIMGLIDKYNPYEKIRDGQQKAIIDIIEKFDPNVEEPIIITMPAPTAFGKSLVCSIAMRIIGESGYEAIGTTPLIELLKQYRDNPNFSDYPCLLGRSNYKCLEHPEFTAADCPHKKTRNKPKICEKCEYNIAASEYDNSNFGWTTFDSYIRRRRIPDVLFVDESAKIESILRNYNSIIIPDDFNEINKIESFEMWRNNLRSEYKVLEENEEFLLELLNDDNDSHINDYVKNERKMESVKEKIERISTCLGYLKSGIDTLIEHSEKNVYNKETRKYDKVKIREFKLLTAYIPFANMITGLKMVVLSSATPSTNLLTSKENIVLDTIHPIPIERRPCYLMPVGKMNYDSRVATAKKMAPVINNLWELYDCKTMIHAGSYPIAELLYDNLSNIIKDEDILLQTSRNRNECPNIFRNSTRKLIWISVEFNEGIDLYGSDYRLNIIAKLPMDLWTSEYVVARREYDIKNYHWNMQYETNSANKVMQSYGRICRGPDDKGDTYILDQSVISSINRYKTKLYHKWFLDALKPLK